ncbi:hypothetical protein [Levilactobacillus yiduensis]|uniref:hypothetical protein n=1 Tax=Levilactobacillus yiduensis TaxID=2953880 RepID=UPI00215811B1|nr:hypothetical protein [Levilactobacillus yiduensis]
MEMRIGNQKVTKMLIGGQVLYDKKIQDASWIECPNDGGDQDFKGLTLMKWDSATNTARFKSNATVEVPKYYTLANALNRLAITLPDGFEFLGNDSSMQFNYHYSSIGTSSESYNVTFEKNRLWVRLTNGGPDSRTFYLTVSSSSNEAKFDGEIILNVKKTN